jgi:hypothetical protein
MDKQIKILLNSAQNINSVNLDIFDKIELDVLPKEITEYNIRNVVNATEVFDAEREENQVYRIYGKIEYLSLLNGLKLDYTQFQDFFYPLKDNCKNIFNSFDFYLLRPAPSGYTNVSGIEYIRYFEVIAIPDNFELFPVGFSNNVYGEQGYSFNYNIDIDISNYFDNFDFPVTELFLYAQYKKTASETVFFTNWVSSGSTQVELLTKTLDVGDFVETLNNIRVGDLIEYSELLFLQEQLSEQTYYILTPYTTNSGTSRLKWKYNPFIPLRLRYLTDSYYVANTGSTSYELVQSIPPYATDIGNGNFVWRNIAIEDYTDPLTGLGTNHPFVNKKRYAFSSIIMDMTPDLTDDITREAFEEVWFTRNKYNIKTTPTGDINNIGKPCL